jgi:hypothetical protein
MRHAVLTTALCICLFAQEEIPQKVLDTGEKVSKELLKQLGSKLKHKMQTEGILEAANFCNANAMTLTEEVNLHQLKGISAKRTSLKERNPANKAKPEEITVLKQMQALHEKKELPPYIVTHKEKTYTYYKPLVIKKGLCLQCHGDINKNEELASFFKKHYPEDHATGYQMGDLRGAIVVEIKQ